MNMLHVALLNETWLYKYDTQARRLFQNIKEEKGICIIRKDRDSREGGIAIAYDSSKITLKKLNLDCLKSKKDFEILAARGKIRGYKEEMNLISCYIPPKLTKAQSLEFLDLFSDTIAEVKQSLEGWIVIGGDWNNRQFDLALDMYPDVKKLATEPTRKDKILDILATNINDYIYKNYSLPPN